MAINDSRRQLVQHDLIKRKTEMKGLHALDFPLRFIDRDTIILHDIRIQDEYGFFQIDILLLHPKCILILEVKNWYGTVIFGENDQVIRINDQNEHEGFPSSITQAKLQRYRLTKWLEKKGYNNMPIFYLIVISFPSTIVKGCPKEVIHSNQLIFEWKKLMHNLPHSQTNQQKLKILSRKLKNSHTSFDGNVLEKYNVHVSELVKGVFCKQCDTPTMLKTKVKWICQTCKTESKTAHLEGIRDYKLLISDTASNRALRDFLGIDSIHIMKRILKTGKFECFGGGRKREYRL